MVPPSSAEFPPRSFPEAPVRADDLGFVVDSLRQGESPCVVGPSNVGKSVLLRSLEADPVRACCAPDGVQPPVVAFADLLADYENEQAFFVALIGAISRALEASCHPVAVREAVEDVYQSALSAENPVVLRELYRDAVNTVLAGSGGAAPNGSLIIVLDEFERAFVSLDTSVFGKLRKRRDDHSKSGGAGYRLCYVIGALRPLEEMRPPREEQGQDAIDLEEFIEMFDQHTRKLALLDAADTRRYIDYQARVLGASLDEAGAAVISELCGGHSGLLQVVCRLVARGELDLGRPVDALVADLSARRRVQRELERLWDSLGRADVLGLTLWRNDRLGAASAQRRALETRRLLVTDGDDVRPFSPLFARFLERHITSDSDGVPELGPYHDAVRQRYWVNGVELSLTPNEAKLFDELHEELGVARSRDELMRAIWDKHVDDSLLYRLVSDLRTKLAEASGEPEANFIETVTGRGYRMVNPYAAAL